MDGMKFWLNAESRPEWINWLTESTQEEMANNLCLESVKDQSRTANSNMARSLNTRKTSQDVWVLKLSQRLTKKPQRKTHS